MDLYAAFSDFRNRLVSDPRFRSAAKANPLTRGTVRAEARALFNITAGFVYSQTLLACIETEVFEFLKDGARSVDEIARHTGLPAQGAERLARAAAAIELLERRTGDRFALGRLGATLVDEPGLAAMIRHHKLLYADLADPLSVLRGEPGGALAGFWGYGLEAGQAGRSDAYSELMAATLPMVAEEIFAACDLKSHRRLLDVGGGEGAFLKQVGARYPKLELSLFDLPPVAERAAARLAEANLSDRAQAFGGSFVHDDLPSGADLISLVRIVHDHGDSDVMTLLRACRAAIAPGGTLLVAEPMADARDAEPMGETYFGLYLMAMGEGRPRTAAQLRAMIGAAGFSNIQVRRSRLPLIADVVTARAK